MKCPDIVAEQEQVLSWTNGGPSPVVQGLYKVLNSGETAPGMLIRCIQTPADCVRGEGEGGYVLYSTATPSDVVMVEDVSRLYRDCDRVDDMAEMVLYLADHFEYKEQHQADESVYTRGLPNHGEKPMKSFRGTRAADVTVAGGGHLISRDAVSQWTISQRDAPRVGGVGVDGRPKLQFEDTLCLQTQEKQRGRCGEPIGFQSNGALRGYYGDCGHRRCPPKKCWASCMTTRTAWEAMQRGQSDQFLIDGVNVKDLHHIRLRARTTTSTHCVGGRVPLMLPASCHFTYLLCRGAVRVWTRELDLTLGDDTIGRIVGHFYEVPEFGASVNLAINEQLTGKWDSNSSCKSTGMLSLCNHAFEAMVPSMVMFLMGCGGPMNGAIYRYFVKHGGMRWHGALCGIDPSLWVTVLVMFYGTLTASDPLVCRCTYVGADGVCGALIVNFATAPLDGGFGCCAAHRVVDKYAGDTVEKMLWFRHYGSRGGLTSRSVLEGQNQILRATRSMGRKGLVPVRYVHGDDNQVYAGVCPLDISKTRFGACAQTPRGYISQHTAIDMDCDVVVVMVSSGLTRSYYENMEILEQRPMERGSDTVYNAKIHVVSQRHPLPAVRIHHRVYGVVDQTYLQMALRAHINQGLPTDGEQFRGFDLLNGERDTMMVGVEWGRRRMGHFDAVSVSAWMKEYNTNEFEFTLEALDVFARYKVTLTRIVGPQSLGMWFAGVTVI